MHKRSTYSLALMSALLVAALGLTSSAGSVGSLTTFQPGTVADANEVNANFASLRTAVNDNDARLSALESIASRRSIHVPARALAYSPSNPDIAPDITGLVMASFSGSLRAYTRRPSDYAGGDVRVTVVFSPTSNTPGVVDFDLEHSGNDCNGLGFRHESPDASGVTVGDQELVHCQSFVVPAAGVDFDVWSFQLSSNGADNTYPDGIRVLAVDWEYSAEPEVP